eukprot:TRINITY_DN3703_c0_g1_i1.p2 TRINITY_DN3703_c0_g1~~TRINITY_DN3703_c0_g1_i1.p2  ORF type:complete len:172 (+),score=70.82 TRINITY_DN3703_c0_g1_i1:95-610(+)
MKSLVTLAGLLATTATLTQAARVGDEDAQIPMQPMQQLQQGPSLAQVQQVASLEAKPKAAIPCGVSGGAGGENGPAVLPPHPAPQEQSDCPPPPPRDPMMELMWKVTMLEGQLQGVDKAVVELQDKQKEALLDEGEGKKKDGDSKDGKGKEDGKSGKDGKGKDDGAKADGK